MYSMSIPHRYLQLKPIAVRRALWCKLACGPKMHSTTVENSRSDRYVGFPEILKTHVPNGTESWSCTSHDGYFAHKSGTVRKPKESAIAPPETGNEWEGVLDLEIVPRVLPGVLDTDYLLPHKRGSATPKVLRGRLFSSSPRALRAQWNISQSGWRVAGKHVDPRPMDPLHVRLWHVSVSLHSCHRKSYLESPVSGRGCRCRRGCRRWCRRGAERVLGILADRHIEVAYAPGLCFLGVPFRLAYV